MAFTNSSLVSYKKISPNRDKNRNHKIDTITIHCVVGQLSVQSLGSIFAKSSKQASSNYGIGYDGKIGLYVEEKDRSWCSSSYSNDHRAITIEVASDTKSPYAVNSKAYNALINLVTDICIRNGIKKLVWSTKASDRTGHKNGCNMTVHRDFASKACPGKYLYDRMGKIAEAVNKKLGAVNEVVTPTTSVAKTTTTSATVNNIKVGEIVQFNGGKQYTSSTAKTGSTAKASKAKVTKIVKTGTHKVHLRACNDKGNYISGVYGWVDIGSIKKIATTPAKPTPSANGKKIAEMAIKCAYASECKEAGYPNGKIDADYKAALNKAYPNRYKWGVAPRAGASCDVFVGTCVRASGVDKSFPRGLDPQYPYLAKSTKFKLVSTAPKQSDLLDGDIIIYGSKSKTEPSHIMIYAGGKLRHAHLKKWYGRTTTDVAARLKGKKMIKLYRAK